MSNKTIYAKKYRKLINHLKLARNEMGLTQQQVAGKMGWKHHNYVAKVESYQRRLDILELAKLARIYKRPLSEFIAFIE